MNAKYHQTAGAPAEATAFIAPVSRPVLARKWPGRNAAALRGLLVSETSTRL